MDQWRPFDIKSFLKASRHWDDDIKRLQEEHDALALLPAASELMGSGDISDMTANAALRRLQITAQIEEIKLYKEMLAFAFRTLTEDERALIDGFYYPKKAIGVFIEEYCHQYGIGRTLLYQEREKLEQRMARVIENRYYDI